MHGPRPKPCPICDELAGCPILKCPCTADGFTVYPGYYQLNPPRPIGCFPCFRNCPAMAQRCDEIKACTAEQIATYKCYVPLEDGESQTGEEFIPFIDLTTV